MPVLSTVATDVVDDTNPVLLQGPDGNPWLIWTRESMTFGEGAGNRAVYAIFDGVGWSAPEQIPGIGGFNRSLSPLLNAAGDLMLVYAHADADGLDGTDARAYLDALNSTDPWFVRLRDGIWSVPVPLAVTPQVAAKVVARLLPNGQLWAVWVDGEESEQQLFAALYSPAGNGWGAPFAVGSGWIQSEPALTEADGVPTLFWSQGVDTSPPAEGETVNPLEETQIFSSTFDGSVWSAPQPLESARSSSTRNGLDLLAGERDAARVSSTLPLLVLSNIAPPTECCDDEDVPIPEPPDPPAMPDPRDPGPAAGNGSPGFPGASSRSGLAGSYDPNDKLGPAAVGPEGFVRGDETFFYVIQFENDPDAGATAPALLVDIDDALDDDLDPDSVRFSQFGWGEIVVTLPAPVQEFEQHVDTTNSDGSPLRVVVTGSYDRDTHVVEVVFQSIDPATGLSPLRTSDGFLLVEDGSGAGQGFVAFSAVPLGGLPSGTQVENQAEIVFDTNNPIVTPLVLRTLDSGPPSSAVSTLPDSVVDPLFDVSWSGDDGAGSGVAWYDVFVSVDGGEFMPWLLSTPDTSAPFEGVGGSAYAFYSVAVDRLGYREQKAPLAEAVIEIEIARVIRLEGDLAFGDVPVGTMPERTFTIHNDGNSPLTVTAVTYPAGFSGDWAGQVAAGDAQQLSVTFAPAAAGDVGGEVTVESDATAGTETILCSGTGVPVFEHTVNLVAGWNAVSLPVEPLDPAVDSVLDTGGARAKAHVDAVWRWTPSAAPGSAGQLEPVTVMDALTGYWVYCLQPATLTVRGTAVANTLGVAAGWAFAGPAAECDPPDDEARIRGDIWGWDPQRQKYTPLRPPQRLVPGNAYWMYGTEAFQLNLAPYE
jgi:hypothetical protein